MSENIGKDKIVVKNEMTSVEINKLNSWNNR